MKTILKTLTLAALLIAVAPAQAMFNRLGSSFAKRSIYTRMNRKPLFIMGALFGATKASAEEPAQKVSNNQCDWYIAATTARAIQLKNMGYSNDYNDMMNSRAFWFTHCEKVLSRDEIYNRNIAYALNESNISYDKAKEFPKRWVLAESWFKSGHEYAEAVLCLQEEQARERSE